MLPRLIILVATIGALSVSIGSRDVSAAAAGLGGAGQLDGAGSAWHGVTHSLVIPMPNPLMSYSAFEGYAWKRCTA